MKILYSMILLSFISNLALADCDFSSGIQKLPNGSYQYSLDCHLEVGSMKQDVDVLKKQAEDTKKVIDLKDLAIQKNEQRANLWMDTASKLEDRVTKIDELQSKNQWLYFGLGILTTVAAAYTVKQVVNH